MSNEFTGYRIEDENRDWLQANSVALQDAGFNYKAARSRKARTWLRVENQGRVGRCGGMAQSTAGEVGFWMATGGRVIQFNGHYSYIRAQSFTPSLYGRDEGSTIDSNLKAAMKYGMCPTGEGDCPDKSWKYGLPAQYTTQIPEGADTQAEVFKIRSHTWITNGQQLHDYVRSGAGAVIVGARWGNWRPDSQGVVRQFRSGGGGHAWCIPDYDEASGMPEMINSHDTTWGDRGWAKLADEMIDGMFRDQSYTAVVGISDLTIPRPRTADWLNADIF